MDHNETEVSDPFDRGDYKAPPVAFPCGQCAAKFPSVDDLARHLFDGHATQRPLLLLRGREFGRSRVIVIEATQPEDWKVANVTSATVNGAAVQVESVPTALSQQNRGVVAVKLSGTQVDQHFEFSLEVADSGDLDSVDSRLDEMIVGKDLSVRSLQAFIDATALFSSANRYRDGIANYFYGVLAREGSPDSGLLHQDSDGTPAYRPKFDDAASTLSRYSRPYAEAITSLIALHYNQFDIAASRTKVSRVAAVAQRLQQMVAGGEVDSRLAYPEANRQVDFRLSDSTTEQVLQWCSCPLDPSSESTIEQMEQGLTTFDLLDQLKLRLVAAEYYLRVGRTEQGLVHHRELRQTDGFEEWSDRYRERAAEGHMS
jgi:hypothetical protein